MAEHNLTIKATLDTSSVQRELDQINRTVMTMNGASGVGQGANKTSAGGIGNLNKISTSIDRLNRTIDKLTNQMTRMGQQALDRGREVISRGGGGYVEVGSPVAPVASGKAGPKTAFGQWVKANRFARADTMPLFMASSWLSKIGSSMEDIGESGKANLFDFASDVAGGMAAGGIRGGAWGAAIGGLVAAFTNVTTAVEKFGDSLDKMSSNLGKMSETASKKIMENYLGRMLENAQDKLRDIQKMDAGPFTKRTVYLTPLLE